VDFARTAERDLDDALAQAGAGREEILRTVSTGYGRTNIGFADETATEIACHAAAVHHEHPEPVTVVDIGGQDSKVIRLDARGHRVSFKMNRKCAAGTGAFLEEIALRLDTDLGELDELAGRATDPVSLGSFCTVFTKTEILGLIRQGRTLEDIAHGVYESVVKRIVEMDPLDGTVVMTGGVVEHNRIVARLLSARLGRPVHVLSRPQLAGAWGGAILAARRAPGPNQEERDA
jgi:predicted CoA-substrate-specific enzyme activase